MKNIKSKAESQSKPIEIAFTFRLDEHNAFLRVMGAVAAAAATDIDNFFTRSGEF